MNRSTQPEPASPARSWRGAFPASLRSLRRLAAPLTARAGLAALACIALVSFAAPARAQTETTLWEATLTVGTETIRETTYYGFDAELYGSLSPSTFMHNSNSYDVDTLRHNDETDSLMSFILTPNPQAYLGAGNYKLYVGSTSFAIDNPATNNFNYTNHGLDWSMSVGETVDVKLVQVTAADTTVPRPHSAGAAQGGTFVSVVFSELLTGLEPTVPAAVAGAFTVTVDGVDLVEFDRVTAGTTGMGMNTSLRMYLPTGILIYRGQTVTVSYDKTVAGADALRDAGGNQVVSFADYAGDNQSTVSRPANASCSVQSGEKELWSATLTVGEGNQTWEHVLRV